MVTNYQGPWLYTEQEEEEEEEDAIEDGVKGEGDTKDTNTRQQNSRTTIPKRTIIK